MTPTDKSFLHLSGNFAKLCGISKSTLHYYVSIGLIQPVLVTDANYKYYSTEQAYTIHLITILQKSGCSLSEIRTYLEGESKLHNFRQILEEKELDLIKQRNELDHTIMMLQTINHFADFAMNTYFTSPREYFMPTTIGLFVTSFEEPVSLDCDAYANGLKKHLQMCKDTADAIQYPIGRIMKERSIYKEDYLYSSLFCFSASSFDAKYFFAKGNYICCVNENRNVAETYTAMMQYIAQKHMTITGNAFELSISVPHTKQREIDCIILIFIPVA